MDSTPTPTPPSPSPQTHPPSIKAASASKSKLPIKRKTPDSFSSSPHPTNTPNPNSSLFLTPKLQTTTVSNADYDGGGATTASPAPPFKFHRIWTEPEEIRFLQCLIDCSAEGISFPKDLSAFFARFSATMPQPYTKSQLSEKLRRLRKKFRVISSRLSKGLDMANLSLHDRSLYELSKQLWDPDNVSRSPFSASNSISKQMKSNLVGVEVSFSPTLPSASFSNQTTTIHESNEHNDLNCCANNNDHHKGDVGFEVDKDVRLSEVNVAFEDGVGTQEVVLPGAVDGGIGEVAGKIVIDVFEHSLKKARMDLTREGLRNVDNASNSDGSSKEGKLEGFERRWREQRVAELDVLARRLRLVLEHSLLRQ